MSTRKSNPKGLWLVQDTWQNTPHLAQNMPRLAQNAHLSIALKSLMPDTLKIGWSAFLSERTLTLKVPHSALSTKIKQISPMLLDGLKMIGWNVDKMEVKVSHFKHPEWMSVKKKSDAVFTARILSPTSSQHITHAIELLPENSPVRESLERILAEHRTLESE